MELYGGNTHLATWALRNPWNGAFLGHLDFTHLFGHVTGSLVPWGLLDSTLVKLFRA